MDVAARHWFQAHTHSWSDYPLQRLQAAKGDTRISVVIPARDEAATVAEVVGQIHAALVAPGLVDELVVIDSDSTDDTAARARSAGAVVHPASQIRTDLPPVAGKGEALWKSLFVTTGDVLVFIDADLTEWGPHFVTGLLGPILLDRRVRLVKGFYDRLADDLPGADEGRPQGGRVTELCARPLLNLYWPQLAAVVQPLAGEWAIRRDLLASVAVPVGYGVEFATLTDTWRLHGLPAIAQVDLGQRGHRHQNVHDLGVMAAEILATAMRRLPGGLRPEEPSGTLQQFDRAAPGGWQQRSFPTCERPPAAADSHYPGRVPCSS
jgi:glucosyl-3-phosphoglycerate synthase